MTIIKKPEKCQFGVPVKKGVTVPTSAPESEPEPWSDEDAEMWVLPQYHGDGSRAEDYVVPLHVIKQTALNLKAKRDDVAVPDEPVEPTKPTMPELNEDTVDTYDDDMADYHENMVQYEKGMEAYNNLVAKRDDIMSKKTRYDDLFNSYDYVLKNITALKEAIPEKIE